jgi:hypothetical protein
MNFTVCAIIKFINVVTITRLPRFQKVLITKIIKKILMMSLSVNCLVIFQHGAE